MIYHIIVLKQIKIFICIRRISITYEGPAVLEVFTDPEEFHEPKVVAKLGEDGKFIPGELKNIQWID
jgi:hypothetical protein